MKKILITGATGFLGSRLTYKLLELEYDVIVLKRRSSNLKRIKDIIKDIQVYEIEKNDISKPFRENKKIDAIIHTATCYGRDDESIATILEANVLFPLKIMETAASLNTPVFLNTDTVLSKHLNAYSLSKNHFLEWGKCFSKAGKIRFVNARLEQMYGPGDDDHKFTTYIIKNCLENRPELDLTYGEQKRDFIYIDDVVSAYSVLLNRAEMSKDMFLEYQVGSGKAISIREFAEKVHKITCSSSRLNFGAVSYRENELMYSQADIEPLIQMGWSCNTDLEKGITLTINDGVKQ